ncbi:NAD-dependent epimerase/dehydratase family protein [Rubrivivax gelatinosus]|uniref:NAD-dependent epimerase/dehydratase family protein n=1 Tax=Rubrivivax gelatinosus TaxID=28068 RepID=UPI003A802017
MDKTCTDGSRCRVLLVGCGIVGGRLLDLLAQAGDRYDVTVVARRQAALTERANLALTLASILGSSPSLHVRTHDISDVDQTTELIEALAPQVIVNASSRQTFWEISTLPEATYRALDEAKIGPWLPNHLALTRRLMLAVAQSSQRPVVVNVAFPDAVNAALGRVGLAPAVGAGNIANAIPTLRRAAAAQLECRPEEIDLRFVAHHYASNAIASTGSPGQAPVILRVFRGGRDVSGEVDEEALFRSFVQEFRRTRGVPGQVVAATNAFAMVQALFADRMSHLHAPGPQGCVGGYPVLVGQGRVSLDLSDAVQRSDAERVNEAGQRLEGIESIGEDGEIRFTDRNMDVMHRILGYRHSRMHVDDVDDFADELQARYQALRSRLGLALAS